MAKKYKTPGVHVEEISMLPTHIAQVETAIPAFVGYTQQAIGQSGGDLTDKPTRITSFLEYVNYFGGPFDETTFELDITEKGPDQQIEIKHKPSNHLLYYSVRHYFDNGGGPCYIVSVGNFSTTKNEVSLKRGIDTLEYFDEPTLIVCPESSILNGDNHYVLMNGALAQCEKLRNRFTIIDVPDYASLTEVQEKFRSKITNNSSRKYGAAYYPNLETTYNYAFQESKVKINHRLNGVPGPMDKLELSVIADSTDPNFNPLLYRHILAEMAKVHVVLPPSGAIAGIYAKVDRNRGVWKAPANVSLTAVKGPTVNITNEEQAGLNIDPSDGKSINAIRFFIGKGTLVWGARTLAGNDNEWRYISVCRFFIMVEESVKKATKAFVFEPNDANTWVKVRTMIENFLTLQWRAGALTGAKPDYAFFVKVGLGQTMTAEDILNGFMHVEIGMAVVRPAEFIILKFTHQMQAS